MPFEPNDPYVYIDPDGNFKYGKGIASYYALRSPHRARLGPLGFTDNTAAFKPSLGSYSSNPSPNSVFLNDLRSARLSDISVPSAGGGGGGGYGPGNFSGSLNINEAPALIGSRGGGASAAFGYGSKFLPALGTAGILFSGDSQRINAIALPSLLLGGGLGPIGAAYNKTAPKLLNRAAGSGLLSPFGYATDAENFVTRYGVRQPVTLGGFNLGRFPGIAEAFQAADLLYSGKQILGSNPLTTLRGSQGLGAAAGGAAAFYGSLALLAGTGVGALPAFGIAAGSAILGGVAGGALGGAIGANNPLIEKQLNLNAYQSGLLAQRTTFNGQKLGSQFDIRLNPLQSLSGVASTALDAVFAGNPPLLNLPAKLTGAPSPYQVRESFANYQAQASGTFGSGIFAGTSIAQRAASLTAYLDKSIPGVGTVSSIIGRDRGYAGAIGDIDKTINQAIQEAASTAHSGRENAIINNALRYQVSTAQGTVQREQAGILRRQQQIQIAQSKQDVVPRAVDSAPVKALQTRIRSGDVGSIASQGLASRGQPLASADFGNFIAGGVNKVLNPIRQFFSKGQIEETGKAASLRESLSKQNFAEAGQRAQYLAQEGIRVKGGQILSGGSGGGGGGGYSNEETKRHHAAMEQEYRRHHAVIEQRMQQQDRRATVRAGADALVSGYSASSSAAIGGFEGISKFDYNQANNSLPSVDTTAFADYLGAADLAVNSQADRIKGQFGQARTISSGISGSYQTAKRQLDNAIRLTKDPIAQLALVKARNQLDTNYNRDIRSLGGGTASLGRQESDFESNIASVRQTFATRGGEEITRDIGRAADALNYEGFAAQKDFYNNKQFILDKAKTAGAIKPKVYLKESIANEQGKIQADIDKYQYILGKQQLNPNFQSSPAQQAAAIRAKFPGQYDGQTDEQILAANGLGNYAAEFGRYQAGLTSTKDFINTLQTQKAAIPQDTLKYFTALRGQEVTKTIQPYLNAVASGQGLQQLRTAGRGILASAAGKSIGSLYAGLESGKSLGSLLSGGKGAFKNFGYGAIGSLAGGFASDLLFKDNEAASFGSSVGGIGGSLIGGAVGGPIGAAVGGFIGSVGGGFIGSLFGGKKGKDFSLAQNEKIAQAGQLDRLSRGALSRGEFDQLQSFYADDAINKYARQFGRKDRGKVQDLFAPAHGALKELFSFVNKNNDLFFGPNALGGIQAQVNDAQLRQGLIGSDVGYRSRGATSSLVNTFQGLQSNLAQFGVTSDRLALSQQSFSSAYQDLLQQNQYNLGIAQRDYGFQQRGVELSALNRSISTQQFDYQYNNFDKNSQKQIEGALGTLQRRQNRSAIVQQLKDEQAFNKSILEQQKTAVTLGNTLASDKEQAGLSDALQGIQDLTLEQQKLIQTYQQLSPVLGNVNEELFRTVAALQEFNRLMSNVNSRF